MDPVQYVALGMYCLLVVGCIVAMLLRPHRAAYILAGLFYGVHGAAFYGHLAIGWDLVFLSSMEWSVALRIHGVATAIILVLAICLMPRLTIRSGKE